jgi:uncharacterized damage-inducible protein DinB
MFLDSIRSEYLRYKKLAEDAIAQLSDAQLVEGSTAASSITTICWHVSGNLRSRFTDFLTTDGEKPWRKRDEEFEPRGVTRAELMQKWEQGWTVLFETLGQLIDADLEKDVVIRSQSMPVHDALHRSLAHTSYHVGQIVYIAKAVKGAAWTSLSIPPDQSEMFNKTSSSEKLPAR